MRKFDKSQVPYRHRGLKEQQYIQNFLTTHCAQGLDMELGCGVGLHALEYVQKRKPKKMIALERTKTKFNKFLNRFNSHTKQQPSLKGDLLPVGEDAIPFILEFIKEKTVNNYFLLHPNPYPKAKHLNKRWYAMPAMSLLKETLKPGGCIHLATNQEYYYKEALDYMQNIWKFSIKESKVYYQGDIIGRTHFEIKYLSRGDAVFHVIFQKPMLG
ncbi:MAG: hypothetical protein HAW63_05060 [Bdellovibrionaceae bacterium]|nr:hypothetical protein [Pseudobdellovibrionaceae bacterium]